jgi:predicted kinase
MTRSTGTVHMVCGPVGAGKTTYGRGYASDRRAVVFVIDEWMANLFMMDAPQPIALDWALPRVERCEKQIWSTMRSVAAAGIDTVAELGFFTRAQRDRFRATAAESGLSVILHSISAPRAVRLERVRRRNLGGETLTVGVDDGMFDWAEGYYEPLAPDELAGAVIVGATDVELR